MKDEYGTGKGEWIPFLSLWESDESEKNPSSRCDGFAPWSRNLRARPWERRVGGSSGREDSYSVSPVTRALPASLERYSTALDSAVNRLISTLSWTRLDWEV